MELIDEDVEQLQRVDGDVERSSSGRTDENVVRESGSSSRSKALAMVAATGSEQPGGAVSMSE